MNDIVVCKAANHMDNCLNLPDVSQKLVSQALPLRCSLYQPCYIAELDGCIDCSLGIVYFMELRYTFVRNGYDSHIRLYGAERVVGCFCSCLGYCVKKCAFAYVWQTYDT